MSLVHADGSPINPQDTQEERTESGLVVPKGTIERKRRAVINQDWKLWRRAIRSAADLGLQTMYLCQECNTVAVPAQDEKALQCQCSRWELPGYIKKDEPTRAQPEGLAGLEDEA